MKKYKPLNLIMIFVILFLSFSTLLLYKPIRTPSSVINLSGSKDIPVELENGVLNKADIKSVKQKIISTLNWNYNDSIFQFKHSNIFFNRDSALLDICGLYPYVEITFEAPNMAINGGAPKVIYLQNCNMSLESTVSFNIYFDILKKLEPVDQTLTWQNSQISIQNINDYWPKKWQLVNLKFYNSELYGLSISKYEILSVIGYNIDFSL